MPDVTSLGFKKPGLNEFYDQLLNNENLDLLDQLIANRLEKAMIANNLLTTVPGLALDARQGKALKELIDAQNDNLAAKLISGTMTAGVTKTINLLPDTVYLLTILSSNTSYHGVYIITQPGTANVSIATIIKASTELTITVGVGTISMLHNTYGFVYQLYKLR